MLTLYVRNGCGHCTKVLAAGQELALTFNERNIADPAVAAELRALGGKQQAPYLVDTDNCVSLYESDTIVAYLHKTFAPGAVV